MNSNLYPFLSGISSLHVTPDGAWMGSKIKTRLDNRVMPVHDNAIERLIAFYPALPVNKTARDFLLLCDGKKTLGEIEDSLAKQHQVSRDIVKSCISPFYETSFERKFITTAENPHQYSIPITGSLKSYFPVHMQFELTEKCNLFCDYCYRNAKFIRDTSFTKRITHNRPYEEVEGMFELCLSKGVANIELSGGEPTMSPYFENIIKLLARHGILVAVETNGTLIDEAMADVLAEAGNVMLSVSLDGPNEEINAAISYCRGAFDHTVRGLKFLADRKVIFRVSSTVCEENIDYIENVLLLARDLGAVQYGAAIAMNFGRQKLSVCVENKEDPTTTLECRFTRLWHELYEKYPKFMAVFDDTTWEYHKEVGNCGVGHRSFGVDPEGNVRICNVNTAKWSEIGNLYRNQYEEIFSNPVVEFFRKLQAPTYDICGECVELAQCGNCVMRGIDKYLQRKEQGEECQWASAFGVDEFVRRRGITALDNKSTTGRCAGVKI